MGQPQPARPALNSCRIGQTWVRRGRAFARATRACCDGRSRGTDVARSRLEHERGCGRSELEGRRGVGPTEGPMGQGRLPVAGE
eukprot:5380099-Alexandrium_andersonii.AAC.1